MKEDIDKNQSQQEDTFDVIGLLLEYLAQWKWFVLSVVLCLGIGYVFISRIVPVYEVSASVYLSDENQSAKSSAIALSANMPLIDTKDYIDETEIEILKSRNNLIKIVDSLDLAYSYYKVGQFRDNPIYGTNVVSARLDSISLKNLTSPIEILVSKDDETYKFDLTTKYGGVEEHKTIETDSLPISVELSHGTLQLFPSITTGILDGKQKIVVSNPNWVAARLSGRLRIEFARNSATILRITCSTPIISESVDVINTLINIYNQEIIADKNRSALQTEAFIIERLSLIAGELQEVEKDVEDYRREKKITDISTEASMYLSQTSANDAEIAQVDAKKQLVNDVKRIVSVQDDYTPIPQVIDDPALNSKIEAYNKKLAQRAAMLEGGTENNPIVQNMQEDLARSKKEISQGIANVEHSLGVQRKTLVSQDNRISGRISNIPTYERELTGIFREQRIKDNIYNFLLEKREEIALQKTLATPTARLIDNPLGSGPVYPKHLSIYGIAALIGILIPALIIFLRRVFFPIFKDKDDLERATEVPILGEISIAPSGTKFAIRDKETSAIAELFRLIRNNIQFALSEKEKKVLMVTSSISGEGKTFIATNVGLTFALSGKKTLIIGMDIRRPVIARNFELSNEQGVTTYLSGQVKDINDIIYKTRINDNLYVLPGGPVPPNPNELLLSERMGKMIDELRSVYDYIIIDTAPIGVVSDTYLIAQYSDVQLYVTRANYSTKRCLKVMHQAIAMGRFPKCYLILNGVNISSGSYAYRKYGYYNKYGYNGSYGYGYDRSEKRTLKSKLRDFIKR